MSFDREPPRLVDRPADADAIIARAERTPGALQDRALYGVGGDVDRPTVYRITNDGATFEEVGSRALPRGETELAVGRQMEIIQNPRLETIEASTFQGADGRRYGVTDEGLAVVDETGQLRTLSAAERLALPTVVMQGIRRAAGPMLALGENNAPWMGRVGRSASRVNEACKPQVPNEPYVTLYRGIQVRRGEPVQGNFGNSQSGGGQMGSTNARDAFSYGLNPPGNQPPVGANELVVIRVNVPRRLVDSGGAAPLTAAEVQAGFAEHLIIPRGVDIRTLPGYRETRIPIREVGTAARRGNQQRGEIDAGVREWLPRVTAP